MKTYSQFSLLAALLAVFCLGSVGAGAAEDSKDKDQEHFSGYLDKDTYAKMVPMELESGVLASRWLGPKLSFANYKKVIIDPVTFYPAPQASDRVSEETLDAIVTYLTQILDDKVGSVLNLTTEPGPQVLRLQLALTGVEIKTEGMKAYEVVPVAAIFGGLKAMTGNRAQDVTVFLEAKATDSVTGELIGAAMRRFEGEKLKGARDVLELEDLKDSLDAAGNDTQGAFSDALKPK